jgi:ribosomal protein S13
MDKKIGAESIPPPSKVEGLQAITKLRAISGCRYCVYTFALNQDIIDKDGKVDDFRGMFFILGTFDSIKDAENHIKDLIVKTKHSEFFISEYGKPIRISTEIDSSNISKIHIDTNNKIKELESEQYKKDKEVYEKRIKLENDIVQETENEYNVDHIDHFQRQCYLAIKNKISYETRKEDMEKILKNYEKNIVVLRDHYTKHPEHEKEWLPNLKEKLQERAELPMYNMIESNYEKYREELLGLDNK